MIANDKESSSDVSGTLYNVCAVPWGLFSTVGDVMSTVGDILSTVGVFSTVGGYHDKCGGIS